MSKTQIRLATVSDLPQLIALRVSMQMEVNSAPDPGTAYRESVAKYFEENLRTKNYVSMVAEAEGDLVAAAGLVVYNKPPSIGAPSGKVGYVTNVYTAPEWRRRGIAGELMKALVNYARTNGLSRLHLGATESGAGVYEAVGFEIPRARQFELKL